MNSSSSEYSSGCESGWTLYFDQLSGPKTGVHENEDDDLSMVSDASSGPPVLEQHRDVIDGGGYMMMMMVMMPSEGKMKKKKRNECFSKKEQHQHSSSSSCLDDTASSSSPVFDFSQDNANRFDDYRHRDDVDDVFGDVRFEAESTTKKRYGLFISPKSKSSKRR